MMNVLLDRFTVDGVSEFIKTIKKGCAVNLVLFKSYVEVKNKEYEHFQNLEVSKGIGLEKYPWVLSRESLIYFSKYEAVFSSMLSRCDVYKDSFTTEEMSEHYYRLLNFWIFKLKSNQIKIIFSLDVPHVPSSFSLYLSAKYLKIPHIYLDIPFVYNKYLYFGCSFTNRMILAEGGELESSNLVGEYEQFIESYNRNSSKTFSKYANDLYLRKESKWWFRFIMDVASIFPFSFRDLIKNRNLNFKGFYTNELAWKVSRRQWCDYKSGFLRINYLLAKYKEHLNIYLSQLRYRRLCIEDIANIGSYILFAPPAEPEAATLPIALESRRVYIALKSIASALPEGVCILYKEHHVSFDHQLSFVSNWKSKYYYYNLKKIKNILFVRDDFSTDKLIKQSIGVACINGSIALESLLVNNKRCITFAPQWYDEFDGIHKCESQSDIREALLLMRNNIAPVPNANDLTHLNNYICLEGTDANSYNVRDYKTIFNGMWKSYETFEKLNDRKWEV